MIIACNKCKTKFRVLDNLIPTEGKKVQCSCCNEIWMQQSKSESSSGLGLWIFWIITLTITFSIVYIGLIIVFGNQIPIPEQFYLFLQGIGVPVDGGELFGRAFKR